MLNTHMGQIPTVRLIQLDWLSAVRIYYCLNYETLNISLYLILSSVLTLARLVSFSLLSKCFDGFFIVFFIIIQCDCAHVYNLGRLEVSLSPLSQNRDIYVYCIFFTDLFTRSRTKKQKPKVNKNQKS